MSKKIFFALDQNCITEEKIEKDIMGGTERFMILWIQHLKEAGYQIERTTPKSYSSYDLCIHSNVFHPRIMAKKHILWAGSWHAQGRKCVDRVIVNSHFMKDRLNWVEAKVIPAPYDTDLLSYNNSEMVPGRIVCHANPNRHFSNTVKVCKILQEMGENFEFKLTGGNSLYADGWNESFNFNNSDLNLWHEGKLSRADMLTLLSSSSVWAYPNLTDNSETLSVASLEAAALGLSLVLPERRPFVDILPEAEFANTPKEFAEKIAENLKVKERKRYEAVWMFGKPAVMPKLKEVVVELIGEPNE